MVSGYYEREMMRLTELSNTAQPIRELLISFGRKLDNDLADQGLASRINGLATQLEVVRRELGGKLVQVSERQKVHRDKLHQLSNFMMALQGKIDELSELANLLAELDDDTSN